MKITAENMTLEECQRRMAYWALDQRQRQSWKDEDAGTYRYRAETLEAAVRLLGEHKGGARDA